MPNSENFRATATDALRDCCQVGNGSKQPIVEYLVRLERVARLVCESRFEEAKILATELIMPGHTPKEKKKNKSKKKVVKRPK